MPGVDMGNRAGIHAVRKFWEQVWQTPQNYDAIDELVVDDFVLISGGQRIDGREAFKQWAKGFGKAISNLDMEEVESFENQDGSRVASIWRLTGKNNGAFGTNPNGKPIEITGIAVWAVREDGMLLSNQVERNAFEVYQQLTAE
jgi:hypothetical protein